MKERKITVYPKTTYSLRSTCEKWGVKKSRGHEKRLLLITGSGRSGTTYAAKTMQAVGLDIPHEKVGAHGTSSLFFLVDSDWYPMLPWYPGRNHVGERRSDFEFEYVVQIVRHPLKTIPSIGKIFNGLNYELFEEQGVIPKGIKNKMLRCAYMYYELNMLAEKQADPSIQGIPCLVLSAVGLNADLDRALALGARATLSKRESRKERDDGPSAAWPFVLAAGPANRPGSKYWCGVPRLPSRSAAVSRVSCRT